MPKEAVTKRSPRRKSTAQVRPPAMTCKQDLPERSMEEAERERKACFAKAWAQKRARELAEANNQVFVPEWQTAERARQKSATDALMQAAKEKAAQEKAKEVARAALLVKALATDDDFSD